MIQSVIIIFRNKNRKIGGENARITKWNGEFGNRRI